MIIDYTNCIHEKKTNFVENCSSNIVKRITLVELKNIDDMDDL